MSNTLNVTVNRNVTALLAVALASFLPSPNAVAAPEKIKLVVWGLQSGKETAGLDAQIAAFEKANPDIDVSNLAMGAGNMNPQKLMTSIVGGVPPDVINQDRFTVGDWASRGTFQPLDDFLKEESGPDSVQASNYYPAAWNEALYEGKVYAIPSGIDDRMLMYNRKIFQEAGLDPNKPPRTWEELAEYSVKLTKKNTDGTIGRIGFIPNFGNSWFYLYSWQNGGEFLSPDGKSCTLFSAQNAEALTYMKKVYDSLGGYDAVNIFQSGFQSGEQDPFFTGKVAMVINGSWMIPNIARYAPDLDFAVAPPPVPAARLKGEGRFKGMTPYVTWTGGYSLAIPKGATHPKEAWRFIRYLLSPEGYRVQAIAQKAYNEKIGRPFIFNLTPNKPINEMLLRDFAPTSPRLNDAQKAYIDALSYAKYRPVTFIGQKLWDAHVRAFERACQGAQTPEAALKEQQALVQKELDKAFARENLPFFPMATWLWGIGSVAALALAFGAYKVFDATKRSKMARSEAIAGYLMASPWILGFLVFTAGPIVASALLAFTDYDVLHPPRSIGAGNFQTLFTDDRELLGKALGNALYLSFYGIPLGMATGLAIAMLLNQKVRGMHWYRTAFYVPSIVPAIASAVLWQLAPRRRLEQGARQRALERHDNGLVRHFASRLVRRRGVGETRVDLPGPLGRRRRNDPVACGPSGNLAESLRSRRDRRRGPLGEVQERHVADALAVPVLQPDHGDDRCASGVRPGLRAGRRRRWHRPPRLDARARAVPVQQRVPVLQNGLRQRHCLGDFRDYSDAHPGSVEAPEVLGALRNRKEVTLSEILYEAFGREHALRMAALGPEDASPESKAEVVKAIGAEGSSLVKERITAVFEVHKGTIAELFVDPDARIGEIIDAVKAECPLSRRFVAPLLGKCQTTRARRLLHWLIVEDPSSMVRSGAFAALGHNATDVDVELLLETLEGAPSEDEPLRGWDGMRKVRLYGGPYDVRAGAAEGLGNAKALSAVEPLIARIPDASSIMLQSSTIRALGEIGDPRAIEPLKRLLANLESYSEMRRETLTKTISMALEKLSAA